MALRAWYKDWAQTARAVIIRKDYLIMLGLSKRRRSQTVDPSENAIEDVGDAEVPTPEADSEAVAAE